MFSTARDVIIVSMKDWTGNTHSTMVTLGGIGHSTLDRQEHDYYATHPSAIDRLLTKEKPYNKIWECACGEFHLVNRLKELGYEVRSSDLIKRGNHEIIDFLQYSLPFEGDILTNPPFKFALQFVKKALDIITEGHKVYMFLRIQFLEGKERFKFFKENPPIKVLVMYSRLPCAMNGDFEHMTGSAALYAWFVWEKGYRGLPTIDWI